MRSDIKTIFNRSIKITGIISGILIGAPLSSWIINKITPWILEQPLYILILFIIVLTFVVAFGGQLYLIFLKKFLFS